MTKLIATRMGVCLLSFALLSTVACKETPKESPKETSPTPDEKKDGEQPDAKAKAEAPKETTPAEEEEVKAPEPINTAKVEALVKEWVKAQNDGDFGAYKASYADKFYGVKRVGPKTYKYDHDGWVKDRARMFKKKMEVKADDIDIQPSSTSAVVKFTQTWASGSYKDVGPKQLVIVEQGGALKISSEEMLSSKIKGADDVKPPAPGELGLVKTTGKHTALVLQPKVDVDLGKGSAKSISRGAASYKKANLDKVDASFKTFIGKTVIFEGPEGKVCQGKVTELAVLAEATPHFGNRQHWDDEMGMGDGRVYSDAEVAQDIYSLAEGQGTSLVALTDAKPDDCREAGWGHLEGKEAVKYDIEYAPDKGLVEMTIDAFQKVAGYRTIQKEWKGYEGSKGQWYDADGGGGLSITAIRGGGKTYMLADAQAGAGCGDFYGRFWAMWELDDAGNFILMSDPKTPGEISRIVGAVDSNNDGKVELVTEDRIIAPVGPVHREVLNAEVPYFDCPC